MALSKEQIAQRIAKELRDGYYVNLGIGIPTLVANYIPGKMVKGMGGAMDLVASAKNIIVAMMHTNPKSESKLLSQCTLPLTGQRCVKKIVTDLAVIDVTDKGFKLLERAPGISVKEIKDKTAGKLIVEGQIAEIEI